jgi:hypothetical protein
VRTRWQNPPQLSRSKRRSDICVWNRGAVDTIVKRE